MSTAYPKNTQFITQQYFKNIHSELELVLAYIIQIKIMKNDNFKKNQSEAQPVFLHLVTDISGSTRGLNLNY